MITIKLHIDFVHGTSPHERAIRAIELLKRSVENSTPTTPALGGALRDDDGKQIGSYLVEFGEEK